MAAGDAEQRTSCSFTQDHLIKIAGIRIGGRNIAADYFMQGTASNFVDLDALASGPVVGQLSAAFDRYWNSPTAFPIASVASRPATSQSRLELAAEFDDRVRDAPDLLQGARDVLGRPSVAEQLDTGLLTQTLADAHVIADSPLKARHPRDEVEAGGAGASNDAGEETVGRHTLALFAEAKHRVDIISPYFVPGRRGIDMMRAATTRAARSS